MEFKFSKSREVCNRCGKEFADGQRYYSALAPYAGEGAGDAVSEASTSTATSPTGGNDDLEEFQRLDICDACWTSEDPDRLYSWWSSVKAPKPKRPPTMDPEFLWGLLTHSLAAGGGGRQALTQHQRMQRAGEAEAPSKKKRGSKKPMGLPAPTPEIGEARALAYLAALGLMRLRQLKLNRHSRQGDLELLHFTAKESGQEFVVVDPNLTDEELGGLETRLDEIRERASSAAEAPDAETTTDDADPATPPAGRVRRERSVASSMS